MNSPLIHAGTSSASPHRILTQLLFFFLTAFMVAWGAWIPLFKMDSVPSQVAFVGLFAPALAALLTATIWSGWSSARAILRRLTIVRFPMKWAVFSLALMPFIYAMSFGLVRLCLPGKTYPILADNSGMFMAASFIWLLLINAGEEIGWRGYALPLLLEYLKQPVLASVVLGIIWGLWHLPLYVLPGQSAMPLPALLVFTTLQSIIYTMVFLRTNGSLIPAILLHAGTDMAPRIFRLSQVPVTFWLIVDLILGLIVTGLLAANRRRVQA